jgi:hypothetical protein
MIDILMAVGVIIGIAVVAYFFGHRTAGEVHKTKEAEQRLEDVKEAQEVRDEIETLDDAGLAARASQWVRRSDKGNN